MRDSEHDGLDLTVLLQTYGYGCTYKAVASRGQQCSPDSSCPRFRGPACPAGPDWVSSDCVVSGNFKSMFKSYLITSNEFILHLNELEYLLPHDDRRVNVGRSQFQACNMYTGGRTARYGTDRAGQLA